jgi:uncharacterized membrane protein
MPRPRVGSGLVAAFAYLLLPVSGLLAYLLTDDPRLRVHGLQAITVGTLWPAAIYGASAVSPTATRVAFAVGAVTWIVLLVGAALGKNPRLPLIGRFLDRAAAETPR